MSKPTVGRIVVFSSDQAAYSGESPAIITRVWSDTCVNLQVFLDAKPVVALTSVQFAEDHAASGSSYSWRWPDRG